MANRSSSPRASGRFASASPWGLGLVQLALGHILWATMVFIPWLRGSTNGWAEIALAFLPLPCLIAGILRQEPILFHLLFPLLLLVSQVGVAADGWDSPAQYVPNTIAFILYFGTVSILSGTEGAPGARRREPVEPVNTSATGGPRFPSLLRTPFPFHAVFVLAAAILLASAPHWEPTLAEALSGAPSQRFSVVVQFVACALALGACFLHGASAIREARFLSPNLVARRGWLPTAGRIARVAFLLAVAIAVSVFVLQTS